MPRIGLGGSQWFDYEYDSTNDALVISRNSDANGSIVIRNQDLTVEGTLNATTATIATVGSDTVNCAGVCTATSFTAVATAGLTATIAAASDVVVVGGIVTASA